MLKCHPTHLNGTNVSKSATRMRLASTAHLHRSTRSEGRVEVVLSAWPGCFLGCLGIAFRLVVDRTNVVVVMCQIFCVPWPLSWTTGHRYDTEESEESKFVVLVARTHWWMNGPSPKSLPVLRIGGILPNCVCVIPLQQSGCGRGVICQLR